MSAVPLADSEWRQQLYTKLQRRNRLVGMLRLAVPAAGLVLFGFLVAQIYIANMAQNYGISGIRFERDAVILDAPTYAGTMTNGTEYKVVAREAQSKMGRTELIDLIDAEIDLQRPDGFTLHARTELAQYDLLAQTVDIPGEMVVVDSAETVAQLHDSFIDWNAQTLHTSGDVLVTYPDGTTIEAEGLVYRAAENEWQFSDSVLTTGGEETETAQ